MNRLFLLLAVASSFCFGDVLRNNNIWEEVIRVNKEDAYWDFFPVTGVTNAIVYSENAYESESESGGRWYEDVVETNKTVWIEWEQHSDTGNPTSEKIELRHCRVAADDFDNATNGIVTSANQSTQTRFVRWVEFTPLTEIREVTIPAPPHYVKLPVRLGVPQSVSVSLPYEDILELLPASYPETRIHAATGFDGYILLRFDERTNKFTIKRLFPETLPYEKKSNSLVVDPSLVNRTI